MKLPADGHENCPLTARGSVQHEVRCLAAPDRAAAPEVATTGQISWPSPGSSY